MVQCLREAALNRLNSPRKVPRWPLIIKDILEDHMEGPRDDSSPLLFVERVKLSGIMTFFFQIFYLQYVINRHVAGSPQNAV